jgi:hypothetical protein
MDEALEGQLMVAVGHLRAFWDKTDERIRRRLGAVIDDRRPESGATLICHK